MTTCVPYTPDTSCDEDWDTYPEEVRDRAVELAWMALRSLTGGAVGNCPVLLRPCLEEAAPCGSCYDGYSWIQPYIGADGEWRNGTTYRRCHCSCTKMCEIVMPGQVAEILTIDQDGVTLPPTDYRLDNTVRLVRTDGECWPACQDMNADPGDPNTVTITYVPGVPINSPGLWAAGMLASEFVKACSGGKCKLPSSVVAISRQGVTMEFSQGMWDTGSGIREVDAYVLTINPNGNKQRSTVWSPDVAFGKHRLTQAPAS